jgi:hypothetical protein
VLNAGRVVVPVEVLLDLGLPAALSGLVEGHLDDAEAAGHDLGHEGRVLGRNVLVVEVLEQLEAHHVLVPLDPVVHLAQLDVADAVIDELQPAGVRAVVLVEDERPHRGVAGQKRPAGPEALQVVLTAAGHEAVDGAAVGLDAGHDHDPVTGLVAQLDRLVGRLAAVGDRRLVRGDRVGNGEGQVLDAVAVSLHLALGGVILVQARGQEHPDVALGQQVGGFTAGAGGQVGVLDDIEPEAVGVEVGRLPGVADVEPNVIHIDQLEGVGAGPGPGHSRRFAGGGHGERSPLSPRSHAFRSIRAAGEPAA